MHATDPRTCRLGFADAEEAARCSSTPAAMACGPTTQPGTATPTPTDATGRSIPAAVEMHPMLQARVCRRVRDLLDPTGVLTRFGVAPIKPAEVRSSALRLTRVLGYSTSSP